MITGAYALKLVNLFNINYLTYAIKTQCYSIVLLATDCGLCDIKMW